MTWQWFQIVQSVQLKSNSLQTLSTCEYSMKHQLKTSTSITSIMQALIYMHLLMLKVLLIKYVQVLFL